MTDDLRHFPQVVSAYGADDERKARFAAIASITAIVLLIVANITPAAIDGWQTTFAAPQVRGSPPPPPTQMVSQEPAGAAPYDCQRFSVKRGQWLQAIVMHRDYTGREWHECYYGSVQIRAGDANL